MTVHFEPCTYSGEIKAPPSKSAAHRLLICAGLSAGESRIDGIYDSDDISATLDCLAASGAVIRRRGGSAAVRGADPRGRTRCVFGCRESGSTLRFLLPVALLSDQPAIFTGSDRLLSRPLGVYEDICAARGLRFERTPGGLTAAGRLRGDAFSVPGNISSQFISGLLFALPLAEEDSVIDIIPPVESASYIEMTLDSLSRFGITVERRGNRIKIPGGQTYSPADAAVEGDWSGAAVYFALNATGSDIRVSGLPPVSHQADSAVAEIIERMSRRRCTVDISGCPDLAPVLMAVAPALRGVRLTGTSRLRLKESDRGAVMAAELKKCGVDAVPGENSIDIPKTRMHAPDVPLCGSGDHRIVMACSILLSLLGGDLEGAEAVNKSYPRFFADLGSLSKLPAGKNRRQ